jgi:dCMP deaminase
LTILKNKFVFAHAKAARNYAEELSYCVRKKVGSLIVKSDSVISYGYNGMPSGEPNVCELPDGTTDPRVRHAEINALRKLIRSSESSVDAVMFVTDSPCPNCAIEIAESGIAAVVFEREYRDVSGIIHLLKKGVKVFRVDTDSRLIYPCDPFHITGGKPLEDVGISF